MFGHVQQLRGSSTRVKRRLNWRLFIALLLNAVLWGALVLLLRWLL